MLDVLGLEPGPDGSTVQVGPSRCLREISEARQAATDAAAERPARPPGCRPPPPAAPGPLDASQPLADVWRAVAGETQLAARAFLWTCAGAGDQR